MIFVQPLCREDLRASDPRAGRGVGEEGFLFLEYKRSRSGSQRDRIQEAGGVEEDTGSRSTRAEAEASGHQLRERRGYAWNLL